MMTFLLVFILVPLMGWAQDHASATAMVSVRIVKNLEIQKTSDLNFGNIAQNSGEIVINPKDKRAGGFSVDVKSGNEVFVSLPKDIILKDRRGSRVQMITDGQSYSKVNNQGTSTTIGHGLSQDLALTNKKGKVYIWFGGKINSDGVKKGVYQGVYTASIAYLNQ